MTTQVPPQPRIALEGMIGSDVAGYKRELHYAGQHRPDFVWIHNPHFGDGMEVAVKAFQHNHGLQVDGEIGPITHAHLWPYGDAYAHWLINHRKPTPHLTGRERLVREMRYLISQQAHIFYAQTRPIPLARILHHEWPVYTDCSGLYTACCYAAGYADPNGFHYSGAGNTDSLLAHMNHLPGQWAARPGDAAIFGFAGDTKHVVGLLEDGRLSDPTVFSHGHAGAPDDPRSYPLSAFLGEFAGLPVTYCSVN